MRVNVLLRVILAAIILFMVYMGIILSIWQVLDFLNKRNNELIDLIALVFSMSSVIFIFGYHYQRNGCLVWNQAVVPQWFRHGCGG